MKGLDLDGWKIEVPQAVEQYAVLHYLPQIVPHSLTVGDTNIAYEVRFSDWAKRKRIEVIPSGVLVVAPRGTRWDGV